MMFKTSEDEVNLLELIDVLQRIGLSDQFDDEIDNSLKDISKNINQYNKDLYTTSLRFRLLRQHGYYVSQDIFIKFMENNDTFKTCLKDNTKGMLSSYESSFLSIKGETILEEAMVFTRKYLKQYVKEKNNDNEFYLHMLVSHAMELPLQRRMQILEARWFIDVYEMKHDMNHFLLELAKLDFNMVQSIHQEVLKQASRWWMETDLGQRITFARDRLMVNFFWTVGISYKPQFQYDRVMMTKVISYILIFDDMYDIYGTLDELEVFTSVVERWDINELDNLPEYMRLIFLSFYNDINEMGLKVLKEKGINIVPYLKKMWADACKSYLLEAKWYNERYTPTLQEYMENGFISITTPLMCLHAYIFLATHISEHTLERVPSTKV